VDTEPRKELNKKEIKLKDNVIIVNWHSKEARILRVSINSFLDHLTSVVETIHMFDN
jgi:EKC/KEOPS complex subunit PCC1/LAGE3